MLLHISDKRYRNDRMDLYRGLCIYGIILIHIPLPGLPGSLVRAAARVGVPFFFLTAGYFSLYVPTGRLLQRALRSFLQLLLSSFIYLLLGLFLALRRGDAPLDWLGTLWNENAVRHFLLYQTMPFPYAWQLWFLGALALVYLIWFAIRAVCAALRRDPPCSLLAILSLILIAIHFSRGEIATLLLGEICAPELVRNVPLDALPFFLLGVWTASVQQDLESENYPWLWLMYGGLALSLAESVVAGKQELYLGSFTAVFGMMGYAVNYPRLSKNAFHEVFSLFGRELTLYLYIMHMLFYGFIQEFEVLQPVLKIPGLTSVVVISISTLLSLGILTLLRTLRGGRGSREEPPPARRHASARIPRRPEHEFTPDLRP